MRKHCCDESMRPSHHVRRRHGKVARHPMTKPSVTVCDRPRPVHTDIRADQPEEDRVIPSKMSSQHRATRGVGAVPCRTRQSATKSATRLRRSWKSATRVRAPQHGAVCELTRSALDLRRCTAGDQAGPRSRRLRRRRVGYGRGVLSRPANFQPPFTADRDKQNWTAGRPATPHTTQKPPAPRTAAVPHRVGVVDLWFHEYRTVAVGCGG